MTRSPEEMLRLEQAAEARRDACSGWRERQWWEGYLLGLRRAHRGATAVPDSQHRALLGMIESRAIDDAHKGRGYHVGFSGTDAPLNLG